MRNVVGFLGIVSLLTLAHTGCKKEESPALAPKIEAKTPPPEPVKPATPPAPLTPEQLSKMYVECWGFFSAKEWDNFQQCYGENVQSEMVDSGQPPAKGPVAAIAHPQGIATALPDVKVTNHVVLVNGNKVASILSMVGTHTGPLQAGPAPVAPTNKALSILVGHVTHFGPDNKIADEATYADGATIMGQLGLTKVPVRPSIGNVAFVAGTEERDFSAIASPVIVLSNNDELEKANVASYEKLTAAFNAHDEKALSDLLSDDVVDRNQSIAADLKGKEAVLAHMVEMWKGFSDLKISAQDTWAAGDWVVSQVTLAGTQDGELKTMKLKKSGKAVTLRGLEMTQFKEGKVRAHWRFMNGMAFAQQLGLAPTATPHGTAKPASPAAGDSPAATEAPSAKPAQE